MEVDRPSQPKRNKDAKFKKSKAQKQREIATEGTKRAQKLEDQRRKKREFILNTRRQIVGASDLNKSEEAKQRALNLVQNQKRKFPGPKIVVFIGMSEEADPDSLIHRVRNFLEHGHLTNKEELLQRGIGMVQEFEALLFPAKCSRDFGGARRQSVILGQVRDRKNTYQILDWLKIADIVVPVFSAKALLKSQDIRNPALFKKKAAEKVHAIDQIGYMIIELIQASGIPSLVGAALHAQEVPKAKQTPVKATLTRYFNSEFGGEKQKLVFVDLSQDQEEETDLMKLSRCLCGSFPKNQPWRDARSYMVASRVSKPELDGSFRAWGFVKNDLLNTNRVAHITGYGNFAIKQIAAAENVYALHPERLIIDQKIQNAVVLDEINEDNWDGCQQLQPSGLQEEKQGLNQDEMQVDRKVVMREVIEGGEENYHEDEESSSDEEDVLKHEQSRSQDISGKHIQRARLEARGPQDMDFPDQVDTPTKQPARIRFQKYRSMKSFIKSEWDPYAGLPLEYSQIFRQEAPSQAEKRAQALAASQGLPLHGQFVRLTLQALDLAVMNRLQAHPSHLPLIISNLFPDEMKVTVSHFILQRHPDSEGQIKSGSVCQIHAGFRRIMGRPIFSRSTADPKKLRYLRTVKPVVQVQEERKNAPENLVVSLYAPFFTTQTPLLMFKHRPLHSQEEKKEGSAELSAYPVQGREFIGQGCSIGSDPERVIIKRIILTGYPYKVKKKKVVVRFMFFNPEDVKYFKPVELFTKHRLKGHIRKSLGTHGLMKCIFNDFVRSDDIMCLPLYRRVFPKWFPQTWSGGELGCQAHDVLEVWESVIKALEERKQARLQSLLTEYNLP